jgi:poly-beta-hydroxyalkanoate depolymerase
MTDIDDMIREIDQSVEWFCDKVIEPVPLNPQDKDKVMKRMVNLGWLRQSEYETYQMATKED